MQDNKEQFRQNNPQPYNLTANYSFFIYSSIQPYQLLSHIQTLTHTNIQSQNNIQHDQSRDTPVNHSQNTKKLINLSTLNTQGLSDFTKLRCLSNSVDNRTILLCTETKIKTSSFFPKNINGRAVIYGSSKDLAKNGTALIIGKDLSAHVFKINQTTEFCSSITLKFKNKINILLTAIYLLHGKKDRKEAVNNYNSWLKKPAPTIYTILSWGSLIPTQKTAPQFKRLQQGSNNLYITH